MTETTFGRYELLARIGSGGMAEVFLAMAQGLAGFNKLVVLKRLRPNIAKDAAMITMFLDEARLSARLRHPNIVNTYEVGEHDGAYFIAMEYLEGQPMNRVLKHEDATSIGPELWCHVFAQALNGLHHAHEQSDFDGTPLEIVHRDLSPHNLFLSYSGEVKVVDFGVARATVNVATTGTGMLKGKANYMAPEQVRGEVDRRADIFTLGLALWEALAGRGAYRGDAVTVLHRILHDPVPALAEACPEIDPKLAAIVMKALEKEPAKRYATAKDFREALLGFVRARAIDVNDEALGEKLAAMFQPLRDQVAARVRQCVSELAERQHEESQALPSLRLTPSTGAPTLARDDARAESTAVSAIVPPPPSVPGPIEVPLPVQLSPAKRRAGGARALVACLGVLGAIAAGAFVVNRAPPPVARAASTVRISFESAPSDAAIEENGQVIGHTPAHLELPAGSHELTIVHEGFERETFVVDRATTRTVVLRPLRSAPAASTVVASAPTVPAAPKAWPRAVSAAAPAKTAPSGSAAPVILAKRKIRLEL